MIERPPYDPEWGRRWRQANARLEELPEVATEDQRRAAVETGYRAHDAGFRMLADFADFRFTTLRRKALGLGYHLAGQPLAPDATMPTWTSPGVRLRRSSRLCSGWIADDRSGNRAGSVAFGRAPALGTVRRTAYVAEALPSGRHQHWTVLINRRSRSADVAVCSKGLLSWRPPSTRAPSVGPGGAAAQRPGPAKFASTAMCLGTSTRLGRSCSTCGF